MATTRSIFAPKRAKPRRVLLALAACLPLAAGLLAPTSSLAAECENEPIRVEQGSTFLPECRAYELVGAPNSPPALRETSSIDEHSNGDLFPAAGGAQAAISGGKVSYPSLYPGQEANSTGFWFLSTRSAEGWTTASVIPPQSGENGGTFICTPAAFFSADLSKNTLSDGGIYYSHAERGAACAGPESPLVANEPEGGFANLFMHNDRTGSYQLVNPPLSPDMQPKNVALEDVAANFAHVLFAGESGEVPGGAPSGVNLYEWTEGGATRPVTYLPEGTAVAGTLPGGRHLNANSAGRIEQSAGSEDNAVLVHAMSSNGGRVFFEAGGDLYLRENAAQPPTASGECSAAEPEAACSVQLDAKQGGSEEGGGTFLYASADGSRAFFADARRLTADSMAEAGQPELYEYNLEAPEGERLKDLTAGSGKPGELQGFSGASEDGSYVYFVAKGKLAGRAVEGGDNLYVVHEGVIDFIGVLNATEDQRDWTSTANTGAMATLTTAASPSGRYFAFQSVEAETLAGYDNVPLQERECEKAFTSGGGACMEVFLYSAADGSLVCASCRPTSVPPTGPSQLPTGVVGVIGAEGGLAQWRRLLLEDGTLFFESTNDLLASLGRDTGGATNVYEYREGQLSMISNGAADTASTFVEASESGQDVFFAAPNPLVAADSDAVLSLYDARVNGGFEAQSAAPVEDEECKSAEGCRMPLGEPPVEAFGASSVFNGTGDLVPAETVLHEPTPAGHHKGGKQKLTRRQKLRRALKACAKRHRKKERKKCRRRARRRFGPRGKHRHNGRHAHRRGRKHRHGKHTKGRGRR